MSDVKTIGFDLFYKFRNAWSLVEVLAWLTIGIWLTVLFNPWVTGIAMLAWSFGRVLSWKQAQTLVHGLRIRIVQDDDGKWYLYDED